MSVLSRDLDSYQRALDAYRRRLASHNRGVDRYNDTLVRDAQGNILVADANGTLYSADSTGKLTPTDAGLDQTQYGLTAIPDNSQFRLLRQNPTQTQRETLTGVREGMREDGSKYYYTLGPADSEGSAPMQYITPEWRLESTQPGAFVGWGDGISQEPTTYTFSRDASNYLAKPDEWAEEFSRQAPDPTNGAARRAARPSLAQIESGLIGEVMRGKGVRNGVAWVGGGSARNASAVDPQAPTPPPANVVEKPVTSINDVPYVDGKPTVADVVEKPVTSINDVPYINGKPTLR